jgi:hypothetical protein
LRIITPFARPDVQGIVNLLSYPCFHSSVLDNQVNHLPSNENAEDIYVKPIHGSSSIIQDLMVFRAMAADVRMVGHAGNLVPFFFISISSMM